jgi:hypothetical protein
LIVALEVSSTSAAFSTVASVFAGGVLRPENHPPLLFAGKGVGLASGAGAEVDATLAAASAAGADEDAESAAASMVLEAAETPPTTAGASACSAAASVFAGGVLRLENQPPPLFAGECVGLASEAVAEEGASAARAEEDAEMPAASGTTASAGTFASAAFSSFFAGGEAFRENQPALLAGGEAGLLEDSSCGESWETESAGELTATGSTGATAAVFSSAFGDLRRENQLLDGAAVVGASVAGAGAAASAAAAASGEAAGATGAVSAVECASSTTGPASILSGGATDEEGCVLGWVRVHETLCKMAVQSKFQRLLAGHHRLALLVRCWLLVAGCPLLHHSISMTVFTRFSEFMGNPMSTRLLTKYRLDAGGKGKLELKASDNTEVRRRR